jgi:DNA primase
MALCPFHPDSKPSMSLKDNRVRCWSCMEKSMDTIEFMRKLEGLSFKEAVRRLNA